MGLKSLGAEKSWSRNVLELKSLGAETAGLNSLELKHLELNHHVAFYEYR